MAVKLVSSRLCNTGPPCRRRGADRGASGSSFRRTLYGIRSERKVRLLDQLDSAASHRASPALSIFSPLSMTTMWLASLWTWKMSGRCR